MELEHSNRLSFFHPLDEAEFLDSMAWINEDSWFAFHKPLSVAEDFPPIDLPIQFQPTHAIDPQSIFPSWPSQQQDAAVPSLFAPVNQDVPATDLAPLNPRRSASASSSQNSPSIKRAAPLSRPISPPSTQRRNIKALAIDDGSERYDSSDDGDSTFTSSKSISRKRSKPSGIVCHTSAFRGVSCCGKDRKFQARIRDGSKVYYLGRFDNELDAALKYDEAARAHKGNAAVPNFNIMKDHEVQALRKHYFQNNKQIGPEFKSFLFQGAERLEAKRQKMRA